MNWIYKSFCNNFLGFVRQEDTYNVVYGKGLQIMRLQWFDGYVLSQSLVPQVVIWLLLQTMCSYQDPILGLVLHFIQNLLERSFEPCAIIFLSG